MITKLIKTLVFKSTVKDSMVMTAKSQNDESVIKEKLGVSTIDEFMKMDIHEYEERMKGL
jgi:hypothetical protein